MRKISSHLRLAAGLLTLSLALSPVLAGCSSNPAQSQSPTPAASDSPSASPSVVPSISPSPSPSPAISASPSGAQPYTEQELCNLALDYYRTNSGASAGETQDLAAAAQANEDGTVTIQVYENLGDHNSTAAWYTVDPVTAQGTDGNGQSVDLDG